MKSIAALLAACVCLVAFPSAVHAANGAEMSMFEQLDINKDTYIDMDEAVRSAQVTADFRQIDTDGDGRLSREEWRIYFGGTGGQGSAPPTSSLPGTALARATATGATPRHRRRRGRASCA